MPHTAVRLTVLLVVAALATACSGGLGGRPSSEATASRIVAGTCIAGGPPTYGPDGDVHPTDALVVGCDKPHIYEVTGVVPIPSVRLRGHHATAANYEQVSGVLAELDDSLLDGFDTWAYNECHHDELETLGLGSASVNGRADQSLEVDSRTFTSAMDLIDKQHWVAHPSVVCFERFASQSDDPNLESSVEEIRGHVTPHFTESSFPTGLRSCYDYTDATGVTGVTGVECDNPHVFETVVTFDARAYLSASQIERERHRTLAQGLSTEVSGRTDRVCNALLSSLGLRWDWRHASAFTDRPVKWTNDQPYLSVECGLVPVTTGDLMLPGGSLVGRTAHPVHLISRADLPRS